MLQKPKVALTVGPVALEDPRAFRRICLRPSPVLLRQVERLTGHSRVTPWMCIVQLKLPVGHGKEVHQLGQLRRPACAQVVEHHGIVVPVIGRWFLDWNATGLVFGHVDPEAKCLDPIVRLTRRARQGIDILETKVDLPRVRLAKRGAALSPHSIGDPGEGRQIALVGRVDEGLRPQNLPRAGLGQVFGRDARQPHRFAKVAGLRPILSPAALRIALEAIRSGDPRGHDAMPLDQPDVLLSGQHLPEDLLGDLWLEHVAALAVLHLRGVLAVGPDVVFADPSDKLREEATHRPLLMDICIGQPRGDDPSDMVRLFQQDHARARSRRRHRRGDPSWSRRDNHDINLLLLDWRLPQPDREHRHQPTDGQDLPHHSSSARPSTSPAGSR